MSGVALSRASRACASPVVCIALPGRPIAFARAARGVGHSYTPEPQASYKQALSYIARSTMAKAGYDLFTGPLGMIYRATYAYPVSWPIKRRRETVFKCSAPDVDNLAKLAADALQDIVYANDAQIVCVTADKRYGEPEGVVITIMQVGAAEVLP